ncbi:hypothetical protein DPO94_21090 [Salmonella enterica subsp. enterica serovar Emek]|jgi:hypothetical protein|uniref:hypothetical protein n=1 Tax=Enterobacteriaceae TaxID=543 RepID=UPI00065008A9|nr:MULTISPECIES: hypothetical protein [Citrobacter]EAQ8610116.1 hypothetical protein [Salmonella enterica]EBS6398460.1 hypothetical protein [Salmonella enterica subsp. enterica serovar Emek]EBW1927965.1 hypothetical protein [Salmonella enterica subsp. enterica serovar Give]EDB5834279.1 hypothetical protein [Salmonella enterica subsp. enterica serovar Agona]NRF55805.1 hypothetical protein [Citrobacter braakii]
MSDQTPIITHEPVNIVLTIENGKVIHARPVQNGEVTASLETFLWMAERAGYSVTPPAGGNDNGPDSDTNS